MTIETLKLRQREAKINQVLRKQVRRDDLIDDAIEAVCKEYDITYEDLKAVSNKAVIVRPRHILFYILHKEYCITAQKTVELLGRTNHVTVLFACKAMQWKIDRNEEFKQHVSKLTKVENY